MDTLNFLKLWRNATSSPSPYPPHMMATRSLASVPENRKILWRLLSKLARYPMDVFDGHEKGEGGVGGSSFEVVADEEIAEEGATNTSEHVVHDVEDLESNDEDGNGAWAGLFCGVAWRKRKEQSGDGWVVVSEYAEIGKRMICIDGPSKEKLYSGLDARYNFINPCTTAFAIIVC